MSSEIRSLENVRERVKNRLWKVPEYRAFLAIEKPMAEVADIPDLLAHLETAKQKILDRVAQTREYRALLTVDKAIKEISEVLEMVGEEESSDAVPAQAVASVPPPAPVVGLAALVQESFSAQLLSEARSFDDSKVEPEPAKVA
jgi:hypothetical protein